MIPTIEQWGDETLREFREIDHAMIEQYRVAKLHSAHYLLIVGYLDDEIEQITVELERRDARRVLAAE